MKCSKCGNEVKEKPKPIKEGFLKHDIYNVETIPFSVIAKNVNFMSSYSHLLKRKDFDDFVRYIIENYQSYYKGNRFLFYYLKKRNYGVWVEENFPKDNISHLDGFYEDWGEENLKNIKYI